MRFSDIPGNSHVKERLRDMVATDRLPHALVLEGPGGLGKFALARTLAQYIHCTHRTPDGEPCGRCPSCVQHTTFHHVDTIFSFPVIKAGRSVALSDDFMEPFRQMLGESPLMNIARWQNALGNANAQPVMYVEESQDIMRKLSFESHAADRKIVLMWLPERMNPQCANKMLKLIEEPLPGVMLIMASDNPREILPTIYSRLQRVEVPRLTDDETAAWLISAGADEAEARAAARLAAGSPGRALDIVRSGGDEARFLEIFAQLMRAAYRRDVAALKKWSNDNAALGREGLVRLMAYCQRMTRENFTANLAMPQLLAMTQGEAAFSSRFAPFINTRNVEGMMTVFDKAAADIAANANAKIVLFDVAVKIILLIKK